MGDDAAKKRFEETKALAEVGIAFSQNHLGLMYFKGKGVLQDHKEAVKWYRKAAEQGFANAQAVLGAMYAFGEGVLQDYVTAYAWNNIAPANGNKTTQTFKSEYLEKNMTPDQIAEGQKLSREIIAKNPKLLK